MGLKAKSLSLRLLVGSAISIIGLATLVVMINQSPLSAFSAYGAGTEANPYRIATCSQLQEVSDDLAGYYTLVSNIDCSGIDFDPIGPIFTGTLDGKNYTVKSLDVGVSGEGLFSETDGATIKNLTLSAGLVQAADAVGSVVGTATDTTLRNVHSSMSVIGDSRAGGLVGQSIAGMVIDQSSFSGDIVAVSYVGGLIGLVYDDGVNTISNSYFDGSLYVSMASFPFTTPGTTAGGLVGLFYGGSISNSYSVGTIDFDDDTSYVGGLIGLTYDGLFTNLFSASSIASTDGLDTGAVFGLFYGSTPYTSTATNVQFDSTRASFSCAAFSTGSGLGCTARNVSNATPNYFKNNTSNVPLSSWNFSTIWTATTGYPALRSMAAFTTTSAAPNAGDANADGIDDSYQAHLLSVQDVNGVWATVSVPLASGCTLANGVSTNAQTLTQNSNYLPKTNLTGFTVYCKTPGTAVAVTIMYDKVYEGSQLHFYNPNNGGYKTVSGASIATQTIAGVARTMATYTVTDGGQFDLDGIANGTIIDPVGLSPQLAGVPNTGLKHLGLPALLGMGVFGFVLIVAAGFVIRRTLQVRE